MEFGKKRVDSYTRGKLIELPAYKKQMMKISDKMNDLQFSRPVIRLDHKGMYYFKDTYPGRISPIKLKLLKEKMADYPHIDEVVGNLTELFKLFDLTNKQNTSYEVTITKIQNEFYFKIKNSNPFGKPMPYSKESKKILHEKILKGMNSVERKKYQLKKSFDPEKASEEMNGCLANFLEKEEERLLKPLREMFETEVKTVLEKASVELWQAYEKAYPEKQV